MIRDLQSGIEVGPDSAESAITLCAWDCTRLVLHGTAPAVVWPVMAVVVAVPSAHVGAVVADLTGVRRASITALRPAEDGTHVLVDAEV